MIIVNAYGWSGTTDVINSVQRMRQNARKASIAIALIHFNASVQVLKMTNCECDYKSFYSNLFWTKASSISNDFANNKHSQKSLTSDNQLKEARLHHMSKTSIIAMTSEFDTRIIKTFTAYHSMHVKVLLIAFDLQCSFYTIYIVGISEYL